MGLYNASLDHALTEDIRVVRRATVTAKVTRGMKNAVEALAAAEGISVSELVWRALVAYLEKEEHEQKVG